RCWRVLMLFLVLEVCLILPEIIMIITRRQKGFEDVFGHGFPTKLSSAGLVYKTADGTWDSFLLLCDNKSDWLTFSCKGCSKIFDVPTMRGSNLKSMTLSIVYYSSSKNITSEGCQVSLLYDEPLDKEMECCHVVDRENVIVFGNDGNDVSGSGGDNEVINQFREETVNHMQITM
ncbi:putative TIR-NBS-LRR resistance protein, partial [Trifolium pratense]